MKYNIQKNKLWKNIPMGMAGDTLGKYGCLVTALANILQTIIDRKKPFTPKDMNDIILQYSAYQYFVDGIEATASFLEWDRFKGAFTSSLDIETYKYKEDYSCRDNVFWIARILFKTVDPKYKGTSGHYVNILSKTFDKWTIFDTYSGNVFVLGNDDILLLHKVARK